jgi:hypothetical protein
LDSLLDIHSVLCEQSQVFPEDKFQAFSQFAMLFLDQTLDK